MKLHRRIKTLASVSLVFFYVFFLAHTAFAALSCSISTLCVSPDVAVFNMFSTTNSHAELPSQNNYPELVCCGGVDGLSNTCSDTFGVVLRLSGTTNAHVEENTETTSAYDGNDVCLSVPAGTVDIAYQDNDCSGFDATVVSLSKTPTNAHVGSAGDYVRQVCATVTTTSTCSNVSCGHHGGGGLSEEAKNEILAISDFNMKVDILDLSILLYYIDQGDNAYTFYDLNKDGVLDFLDVSILFYYWSVF